LSVTRSTLIANSILPELNSASSTKSHCSVTPPAAEDRRLNVRFFLPAVYTEKWHSTAGRKNVIRAEDAKLCARFHLLTD
jgi:hypothetical protein